MSIMVYSFGNMETGYLQTKYQNDEDKRTARALFRIILGLLVIYLVGIGYALYWGDWNLFIITLVGCILLPAPFVMLFRGNLRTTGLVVVLNLLISATIIATDGQGIHDIVVVAYPVIVIIASLTMKRRDFFLLSLATLGAMGWLVFGEAYGWFVSKTYDTPRASDFLMVAVIMLVTIIAVDQLAENMRGNLHQAKREILQRKKLEAQIRNQSIHDALTGIYNRVYFEEELSRLERGREFPVSVIVADVDNLKNVNDTQGHNHGDELLQRASLILQTTFRESDMLARIGGDEFVVLLPRTDSSTVAQILSRIQTNLAQHNLEHPELPLQLSLGASTAEQHDVKGAFIAADQRMYADKSVHKSKHKQSKLHNIR